MSEKMSENRNKDFSARAGHRSGDRRVMDGRGPRARKDKEQGRSMVEMLGVLAIVGVLSAGAIGGYSYAMNKHRTNELIYEATKRAQWVGTQLEMNNPNPSLNTFGTDSFGGGTFTGEVLQLENGQIGIKVAGLKEAVCQNILNSIADNTVVREMKDVNCDNDNGTATLVFNRDLSTSDSETTPNEPEVSGEVSEQASTEAPTTQNPDDVHCNGNGSWNGSSCYCDNGWQGDNCSEEEPESSETATGEHEPEETATGTGDSEPEETATAQSGEDHTCSGNGYWNQSYNNGAGGCSCYAGWGGSDCSEDKRYACGEHGVWIHVGSTGQGSCSCDSGYGGSDCSVNGRETYCNNHGNWIIDTSKPNGGFCSCDSEYGSSDCSEDLRAPCSNHGTWNGSSCTCDPGYDGSDCSIDTNDPCSGHGDWPEWYGACRCNVGWGGSDCSEDHRNDCGEHGSYVCGAFCHCDSGWGGSDCSTPK